MTAPANRFIMKKPQNTTREMQNKADKLLTLNPGYKPAPLEFIALNMTNIHPTVCDMLITWTIASPIVSKWVW